VTYIARKVDWNFRTYFSTFVGTKTIAIGINYLHNESVLILDYEPNDTGRIRNLTMFWRDSGVEPK
jgi:hypothetical protein